MARISLELDSHPRSVQMATISCYLRRKTRKLGTSFIRHCIRGIKPLLLTSYAASEKLQPVTIWNVHLQETSPNVSRLP